MTVKDAIIQRMKDNGFDGLFSEGGCSCELGDLAPCSADIEVVLDCSFGHKVMCTPDCRHEFPYAPGEGQWHIQAEKPEETRE